MTCQFICDCCGLTITASPLHLQPELPRHWAALREGHGIQHACCAECAGRLATRRRDEPHSSPTYAVKPIPQT